MPNINKKLPTYQFSYEIIRTKRKTLAIHIKSGKVELRSPLKAPNKWIFEFLSSKAPWVEKQLAEQEIKLEQKLIIADTQEINFFGHPRIIQVIISTKQKVEISSDSLSIYTRKNTPEQLEKLFNKWLIEQAREYMATQTIKTARQIGLEHKLKEVVFRKTKTKWGHCCADGTIQYNWLTMMAPKPVVDYLIAHETSHLLHMNHSKRFWSTVESLCPDYLNLRDWFKHNGHRLWTQE